MTLDQILEKYFASTADDWHRVHAPLAPETHAHEALFIYKADVSIAVAWGLSAGDYNWNWVEIYPDPSAYKFYIDLLYNGVPVFRRLAVAVDGGRADLPSPAGYLDSNDPSKGWQVIKEEYDFVRQFSVIRSETREVDSKFQQAERAGPFTIVETLA